jgi:hypothetical protein
MQLLAETPMDIVYALLQLEGMEVLSCCGGHSFANHLHDGYVLWLNSEAPFWIKGSF